MGNLVTGLAGHHLLPALYGRRDFGRAMPRAACAPILLAYMLALTLAVRLLAWAYSAALRRWHRRSAFASSSSAVGAAVDMRREQQRVVVSTSSSSSMAATTARLQRRAEEAASEQQAVCIQTVSSV